MDFLIKHNMHFENGLPYIMANSYVSKETATEIFQSQCPGNYEIVESCTSFATRYGSVVCNTVTIKFNDVKDELWFRLKYG